MSIRQWPEGPVPQGDRPWTVFDIDGPSSYTAISQATPPTGGQVILATDLGMKQIDFAIVTGSDNGQYSGVPFIVGGTGNPSSGGSPNYSRPGSQINLMWTVANGGAEASGDLHARSLRLLVIGR